MLQDQSQLNWTAIIWMLEIQLYLLIWKVKKRNFEIGRENTCPVLFSTFSFSTLCSLLLSLLLSYFSELQRKDWDNGEKLKMVRKVFGSSGLHVTRVCCVIHFWENKNAKCFGDFSVPEEAYKKNDKCKIRKSMELDSILRRIKWWNITIEDSLFLN